jgi:predicted ArsR family transcriptional regulator
MNFTEVSKISNLLAKEYAADFLRLLKVYKTISASEASSLLELHIKTAQDFLEGLTQMGILKKEEKSRVRNVSSPSGRNGKEKNGKWRNKEETNE